MTFRLEDKNTNKVISFEQANTSLELIRRLDLCTRANAHIRIVQL